MTNKRIKQIIREAIDTIIQEEVGNNSIYADLDYKVEKICYQHGFNVQTNEDTDGTYRVFFQADERDTKVQEAIQMLKDLGLKYQPSIVPTIHLFEINFK